MAIIIFQLLMRKVLEHMEVCNFLDLDLGTCIQRAASPINCTEMVSTYCRLISVGFKMFVLTLLFLLTYMYMHLYFCDE